MSSELLVGIDLGTTNVKAVAFDAGTGAVRASASRRLRVRAEADGTREQDPLHLRRMLARLFASLRRETGSAWSRVAGIGLGAQGGSGVIVKRATGEPLTPMILWNDLRGRELVPQIESRRPPGYWEKHTRRRGPGAGLGRMLWWRQQDPSLFRDDRLYVGAGEYAYFLMTGVWRQDACNALQIGCYSVPDASLNADALGMIEVPPSFVAPLRRGHQTHPLSASGASWLGLPDGVPVAGPYIDHELGYQSAWGISARPLQASLGTAWVGNFTVRDDTSGQSPLQLILPSPVGEGRLVILPLLTGNTAWDWALDTFVSRRRPTAMSRLAAIFDEALLPPDGLVGVPWLAQPNPLFNGSLGAGTFYGMHTHTSPHDFVRAVACGLCYEFMRVFGTLVRSGRVDSLVLGGGASKGDFFRRLFSSLAAPLSVYSLEDEDLAGARGAVFAFDRKVAQSTPVPVAAADPALRTAVREGAANYVTLFDRVYGDLPGAAPYRVS